MNKKINFIFCILMTVIIMFGFSAKPLHIVCASSDGVKSGYYIMTEASGELLGLDTSYTNDDELLIRISPSVKYANKQPQLGKLVYYNSSGNYEDIATLGYGPFEWVFTKDYNHLFITYHLSNETETTELVHVNLTDKTIEKLTLPVRNVNALSLSFDESNIHVLGDNQDRKPLKGIDRIRFSLNMDKKEKSEIPNYTGKFLTLSYVPLAVKLTLETEKPPIRTINLTNDRVVLICQDWVTFASGGIWLEEGDIQLLDLDNNVIEKRSLTSGYCYAQIFNAKKTLILTQNSYNFMHVNSSVSVGPSASTYDPKTGNKIESYRLPERGSESSIMVGSAYFYKITDSEIITKKGSAWLNFEFYPELNCIYSLGQSKVELINFKDKIKKIKFDRMTISESRPLFLHHFYRIPGTKLAVIYGPYNYFIHFFDLEKNKIIKTEDTGRRLSKFVGKMFGGSPKIEICSDLKNIYALNHSTDDITIFDIRTLKKRFIVSPEPPLRIIQTSKNPGQILLITVENVFKLNEAKTELLPIYEFKEKAQTIDFIENEAMLVLFTEQEKVEFNIENLELISTSEI